MAVIVTLLLTLSVAFLAPVQAQNAAEVNDADDEVSFLIMGDWLEIIHIL